MPARAPSALFIVFFPPLAIRRASFVTHANAIAVS